MSFKINYPRNTTIILKRKKTKEALQLLRYLAFSEPSNTHQIAKLLLPYDKSTSYVEVKAKAGVLFNILRDRPKKNNGRYLGLVTAGFVKQTYKTNEKMKKIPHYNLTLKGCFLALGFGFSDNELKKFIKIQSRNHLYFAYVYDIIQKTSLRFGREVFIESLFDSIKTGMINLDKNIQFYFPNIGYAAVDNLENKIKQIIKRWDELDKPPLRTVDWMDIPQSKPIITLIKNTWYDSNTNNWTERILDYYYPTNDEKDYYYEYSDQGLEESLLYKLMQPVHESFYSSMYGYVPRKHEFEMPKK